MRTRILAGIGAAVVVGGIVLGIAPAAFASDQGVDPAATQQDCDNAKAATVAAKANLTNALNVAIARAKELGFTQAQIDQVNALMDQTGMTREDLQSRLMQIFSEHAAAFDPANDLAKVLAVINNKLAFDAAVAAQNVFCAGLPADPAAPAATPGAVPALPLPSGAPQTGDGSRHGG
jgi:hypothetical protein